MFELIKYYKNAIERLSCSRNPPTVGPCVGLSVITQPTNSEPPGVLVEPVLPFRVLHSSHQLLPKASDLFVVRVADLGANIFRRHNVPAHQDFWVCWSHAQGPCSFRKSLACSRSEVFRIFADRVPPFGCRASLADKGQTFLALLSNASRS
jgi:hypothetical protein